MKNKLKQFNMSYEPEADVLRIEVSKKPIEYAKEMGNVIVHFSPEGLPVYLEILGAKDFLKNFQKVFKRTEVAGLAETPA